MEFVEAPAFTRLVSLYLDDDHYRALQAHLAGNPEAGDVVRGTGGFRKMRWQDARRGKGSRGGLRVVYYLFRDEAVIWLMTVYDKNDMEDLTPDQKRALRRAIQQERLERETPRNRRARSEG
ncbi:MAG: toxin [Candidatus Riflebacteria bacterium]|nr:toxin [Candidatus Riflebacteria bacterium]